MKKYIVQLIIAFLLAGPVFTSHADEEGDTGWGFFDGGKDYIWKSGRNVYFKYETFDTKKYGLNDHPVRLDAEDISAALRSLIISGEEYFSDKTDVVPVFSARETALLGRFISKGLQRAKPDQDIVFVTEAVSQKLIVLKDKTFNSGKVFYRDDRLNLIFGEYRRYRNDAFERQYDPGGQAKLPYFLNHGKRGSPTGSFHERIVRIPGVENKRQKRIRRDWFVIDVNLAAQSYIARRQSQQSQQAANINLEKQAAQLARDRREMRREMARLRKEMKENKSVSPNSGQPLEKRLQRLLQLKDKGLITEEEYTAKRREILDDI